MGEEKKKCKKKEVYVYNETKRDNRPASHTVSCFYSHHCVEEKPPDTCVRFLTSTSWWSSDPCLAAELVSVVFAWLRLELHGPARLAKGERRRGRKEEEEEDLDWLSNTKR